MDLLAEVLYDTSSVIEFTGVAPYNTGLIKNMLEEEPGNITRMITENAHSEECVTGWTYWHLSGTLLYVSYLSNVCEGDDEPESDMFIIPTQRNRRGVVRACRYMKDVVKILITEDFNNSSGKWAIWIKNNLPDVVE